MGIPEIGRWGLACFAVLALSGCGGGETAATPMAGAGSSPPVADFTLAPTRGTAPLAVQCADTSTGTISARSWSFGDGGTSTEISPSHSYASPGSFQVSLTVSGPGGSSTRTRTDAVTVLTATPSAAWRFAVLGDTHLPAADLLGEMAAAMAADGVQLVLVPGDLVQAGSGVGRSVLQTQLGTWQSAVAPLSAAGIGVYPLRGNHEADVVDGIGAWNSVFSGSAALPANGPPGETNLSYSFVHRNALLVGLDNYASLHRVNQPWLDQQLAARGSRPHIFVFGHEPAFKVFHGDGLDDSPAERDAFWASLAGAGARALSWSRFTRFL